MKKVTKELGGSPRLHPSWWQRDSHGEKPLPSLPTVTPLPACLDTGPFPCKPHTAIRQDPLPQTRHPAMPRPHRSLPPVLYGNPRTPHTGREAQRCAGPRRVWTRSSYFCRTHGTDTAICNVLGALAQEDFCLLSTTHHASVLQRAGFPCRWIFTVVGNNRDKGIKKQ